MLTRARHSMLIDCVRSFNRTSRIQSAAMDAAPTAILVIQAAKAASCGPGLRSRCKGVLRVCDPLYPLYTRAQVNTHAYHQDLTRVFKSCSSNRQVPDRTTAVLSVRCHRAPVRSATTRNRTGSRVARGNCILMATVRRSTNAPKTAGKPAGFCVVVYADMIAILHTQC